MIVGFNIHLAIINIDKLPSHYFLIDASYLSRREINKGIKDDIYIAYLLSKCLCSLLNLFPQRFNTTKKHIFTLKM